VKRRYAIAGMVFSVSVGALLAAHDFGLLHPARAAFAELLRQKGSYLQGRRRSGGVMEKLEEILTRFGDKIANAGDQDRAGRTLGPHLLPDRHPVHDFFIADIAERALKDDRDSRSWCWALI